MSAAQQMLLGAMLPYFGGKRTLADEIIVEFGPHRSYWELFCGSLAVLFAKESAKYETVNDLNGDVTTLARVLASDEWELLHDRVSRTLFCEGLYRDSRDWLAAASGDADELDRAYHLLVVSWMGRNGTAGLAGGSSSNFCTRFTHNGGSSGLRFSSVGQSIPAWHERLQHVCILQRDAVRLAAKIADATETVIYVDAPYLRKTKQYKVDMTPAEHRALAEVLCTKRQARVVVSYYDEPELAELYPGWTRRPLAARKTMAQKEGGAPEAPEILLLNGPSYAEVAA